MVNKCLDKGGLNYKDLILTKIIEIKSKIPKVSFDQSVLVENTQGMVDSLNSVEQKSGNLK